jgi:hypothetical protein
MKESHCAEGPSDMTAKHPPSRQCGVVRSEFVPFPEPLKGWIGTTDTVDMSFWDSILEMARNWCHKVDLMRSRQLARGWAIINEVSANSNAAYLTN